jgi:hypothetical protein
MTQITINLDQETLDFVNQQAQGDLNNYINSLLKNHRSAILEAEMIKALKEDLENEEYQTEIQLWDNVVGDGIDG